MTAPASKEDRDMTNKSLNEKDCQWRPIRTAPRDGSDIILLAYEMEVEARYWPLEPSTNWEGEDTTEGGCWICFDDRFQIEVEEVKNEHGIIEYWDGQATHWKPKSPLPTYPKERAMKTATDIITRLIGYAGHDYDCRYNTHYSDCTCGYSAAIADAREFLEGESEDE